MFKLIRNIQDSKLISPKYKRSALHYTSLNGVILLLTYT
jgi:hypothetical protein